MTRSVCTLALLILMTTVACHTTPEAREASALRRGMSLLGMKDYGRALLEFVNAAQSVPNDAEPYYRMGLAYSGLRDIRGAAAAFRRATELNPKHAGAQVKLAEMLAASRNAELVEDAYRRLEAVLTARPGDVDVNDALALAEWKLGHPEDAESRFEQSLERSPADLKAAVAVARIKQQAKDLVGAEEVLRRAAASAPRSPEAALALAQFYWRSTRLEEAEAEIRRALQLDPQNGPALGGLAAIELSARRVDEADETYRRLSALPGNEYKHLHALFLFQTGKRDAAVAEFIRLVQKEPGNRNVRGLLLAAYISMDKVAEGQRLLAGALKKNSKDTDALLQRAKLYLRLGNASAAENDLNQLLVFKSDSAQAHLALAEAHRLRASPVTERQELNETLRLDPSMLAARLALARNLSLANQGGAAVDVLDCAPTAQKTMVSTVTERNWALFAAGRFKEMRVAVDHALKAVRSPELLIQDGLLKMRERDYTGARDLADEVLRRDPQEIRAARILAASELAQNQPARAIERIADLAHAHPQSAKLQYLLAQCRLVKGESAAARQALEAAKTADPNFIEADLAVVRLDRDEKRWQEARQRLAMILNAYPKNLSALLMLAGVETETGNRNAAIVSYRAALDVDGSNLIALNNLASILVADGPDEALKYAQQAAEIAPDNPVVEDTLGWVYYRKEIFSIAVDYLKRAVAKAPTPRLRFHLGMAYLKAGDKELGRKTLAEALRQDPGLLETEKGW